MKRRTLGTLFALFFVIFLLSAWKIGSYYWEGRQAQNDYEELADQRQEALAALPTYTTPPQAPSPGETVPAEATQETDPYVTVTDPQTGETQVMLPEFALLYQKNPDIVGWISIPGTSVDYPVVQTPDREDYYLYRYFSGVRGARGCIYADEPCDVLSPSDNVTIYGHMMQDGTMFAPLKNYKNREFWEKHPYIRFDSLQRRQIFEVVSVFITSASPNKGFAYHKFVWADSPEAFDAFWNTCQDLSLYDTGAEVAYGDKLITLSTCDYSIENGRLVVVAKRINQ